MGGGGKKASYLFARTKVLTGTPPETKKGQEASDAPVLPVATENAAEKR
jgi:hypothetical protein